MSYGLSRQHERLFDFGTLALQKKVLLVKKKHLTGRTFSYMIAKVTVYGEICRTDFTV